MPSECDPHELTLVSWPTERWDRDGLLNEARLNYAAVIDAIAAFEPVMVVADPVDANGARKQCPSGAQVVEVPLDDSWIRDNGPIVVRSDYGSRAALDFQFNAWGRKFPTWERDNAVPRTLSELLGIERLEAPIVLEGGSISVDGEGTLITTEQCLLDPSRNPDLSRGDLERVLAEWLGVEKVIWLDRGLVEDLDTDGHVDNVCAFAAPGSVILQVVEDPRDPNFEACSRNREILEAESDARGRRLEVTEMRQLPRAGHGDRAVAVPYTNFYVANGAVIVPVADDLVGSEESSSPLATIAHSFPDREIVPVPSTTLARGGGGIHCITQQVPAGVSGGD